MSAKGFIDLVNASGSKLVLHPSAEYIREHAKHGKRIARRLFVRLPSGETYDLIAAPRKMRELIG